jgi:hypothetical protein
VWGVPGAVAGTVIGTGLQGRLPARTTRLVFAMLFGAIGVVFVAAFGLGFGPSALS